MRISEETIAAYRPNGWQGLIGLPWSRSFDCTLPCEFFSDSDELFPELKHGEPVALLAFTTSIPRLAAGRDWYGIDHQAGGYACDHPHLVGLRLTIRPSMAEKLKDLVRRYLGAAGGHLSLDKVTASDIVGYTQVLADLGLHCDSSYRNLQEGVYPIDATSQALALIADEPPDLDLVKDPLGYGGLAIVILAENSD